MKLLRKVSNRFFRGQAGLTLIEVVIALGILGVLGTGMLSAIDTGSRATRTLDEQVVASNLVSEYLEAIRESPYAETYDIDITHPSQYSVNVTTAFSDNGSAWVGTHTDEKLQKITITVSREGRPVLSVCTFKTER
ncbi:MAG: prepilin-type N-terminal cleavage/methylation domain-containing protein [Dehalococcoidales bacterium]|nr:prepilin-type N-terminal cleavage/methylation domain-containing protein [Dehalococcoidales bacterium]